MVPVAKKITAIHSARRHTQVERLVHGPPEGTTRVGVGSVAGSYGAASGVTAAAWQQAHIHWHHIGHHVPLARRRRRILRDLRGDAQRDIERHAGGRMWAGE